MWVQPLLKETASGMPSWRSSLLNGGRLQNSLRRALATKMAASRTLQNLRSRPLRAVPEGSPRLRLVGTQHAVKANRAGIWSQTSHPPHRLWRSRGMRNLMHSQLFWGRPWLLSAPQGQRLVDQGPLVMTPGPHDVPQIPPLLQRRHGSAPERQHLPQKLLHAVFEVFDAVFSRLAMVVHNVTSPGPGKLRAKECLWMRQVWLCRHWKLLPRPQQKPLHGPHPELSSYRPAGRRRCTNQWPSGHPVQAWERDALALACQTPPRQPLGL
mmetsp:Transcript_102372/g.330179  ORF Transcript_102372/g.330179 Transcript_102372/m.330179 type:complete len:268 (-) Transcript_102372:893-1696(-)